MTKRRVIDLSAPATTVRPMIHPWRRFRSLADWTLLWHQPDDDARKGVTTHSARTISLRADLSWAERRCTVLHECLHAEHGPVISTLRGRHENAVRRETARLLLPEIQQVGEAMAWSMSLEECADELCVDVEVLADRLHGLHPSERHYLARRLADD